MASNGDEEKPCTPEELLTIISEPSGGFIMLPNDPFDKVYDNIYLGEESIAKSPVGLKQLGITHVLNTAEGEDDGFHVRTNNDTYQPEGIKYLGVRVSDQASCDVTQYFDECSDYIEAALADGGKVMVNCKMGASRSATIVIAYLMLKRRVPVQEAVRILRAKREICPNDGFLQQLCDFNKLLKDKGHFSETKKEETTSL